MNATAQALGQPLGQLLGLLTDGAALLGALGLLLWSRPVSARAILWAVSGLVGLIGTLVAATVSTALVAAFVAFVSVGLIWLLYRPALPADIAESPGPWPVMSDRSERSAPDLPRPENRRLARVLPALSFVLVLLLSVLVAGRLDDAGIAADTHAFGVRMPIAVGLTMILSGAVVCADQHRPGLVQVAGAVMALLGLGWAAEGLAARGPEFAAIWAPWAGAPAAVLLGVVAIMRSASAGLRGWLEEGEAPAQPRSGPPPVLSP